MGATHPETLLAISKGKCYKNFRPQRNIDIKGQIVVFDYFCAKREGIFEVLCISKGKLRDFSREARRKF